MKLIYDSGWIDDGHGVMHRDEHHVFGVDYGATDPVVVAGRVDSSGVLWIALPDFAKTVAKTFERHRI